jgi:zinc protease
MDDLRYVKRALALLLCMWLLFPVAAATAAEREPFPPPFQQDEPFPLVRFTLANGLRVWCQPRPDSQSVAALLVIGAGSRDEEPSNNGVSHFVEHMAFVGTERWTEEEIKEVITRLGGTWNGWTGQERTVYFAHVASQDVETALDWLAEIVFHATLPADKVDKEREVIFQERWGRYGWLINLLDRLGFGYELDRNIRRALFPDSTLGLRVGGEDASLESLDRAELLAYYQRYYTPGNAVLIVVGNVTPQQTLALAQQYYALPRLAAGGKPPVPATPRLPDKGPQQVVVRGPMPTNQVELMIGARTVGRAHPDRWALAVLAEVLDKELTEEIRDRQGLVYSLGAYNDLLDDAGYFVIETMAEGKNRKAIQRAIQERLGRMRQGEVDAPILQNRVAEAKTALQGRWALAMENNLDRALWLADWVALPASEPVPDYPAAIGAVTAEDLPRVVDTYFTPQRSYVGLHLPVATVASGAGAVGIVVVLALGAWGARRIGRRRP